MFKISKTVEDGKAVLAPEGRLDTVTAPEMEKAVKEVIPEIDLLTIDLEKLDYISSAGLRVLLFAHKAMKNAGGIKVRNVNETISEIFEVTGFSDILDIE